MNTIGISVISNRTHITLMAEDILYLSLSGRKTAIHITGGRIYETYTPIDELAKNLGSTFIRVDRCYLVSAKAIHDVTKTIDLINGESLDYARRRKREIVEQLRIERQKIGRTLERNDAPASQEEYHRHYASFDHVPFAFTDIEMVFSEEHSAVDWIFRYGNRALAELEKLPLEQLIDHSFGSIFPNMDAKWLRGYERTALYGETLEITDYSPEIDTDLKIICFPTFKGHCGCMLFDRRRIQTVQSSTSEDNRANHRRSVDSCFRIIRQKHPAFMSLSQLYMQNVTNAS